MRLSLAEFSEPRKIPAFALSNEPPDLGLEKGLWRLPEPRSCRQMAVNYLRTGSAFLLATSGPLFHVLFFKSTLCT